MAETEQGRAVAAIGALDAGFDSFSFVREMQERMLPALTRAFFRLDLPVLRAMCKDTALAQMKSVQGGCPCCRPRYVCSRALLSRATHCVSCKAQCCGVMRPGQFFRAVLLSSTFCRANSC